MEREMTFGERMRQAREAKGLSQAELARKVGLSRSAICGYEKTRRTNIAFPIAVSIGQVLGMSINDDSKDERSITMCNNDNNKCNNKCDNKSSEDLKFFLDGYVDTDDDTVIVPREEYAELIAECTILRVVEKLAQNNSVYCGDLLKTIRSVLEIGREDPDGEVQYITHDTSEEDAE